MDSLAKELLGEQQSYIIAIYRLRCENEALGRKLAETKADLARSNRKLRAMEEKCREICANVIGMSRFLRAR